MKVKLLSEVDYQDYGNVISVRDASTGRSANQGTAIRYDHLADCQNLRPNQARLNICVFRASPHLAESFVIRMLENHPNSTQVMIPMNAKKRYLVIVALGASKPDLSTLQAFIAKPNQGISYHPGVWHHPLIALDQETDFVSLVYEDGTEGDCKTTSVHPLVEFLISN